MDAEYLKANVGVALAKGIAAVSISQPQDPVEYLALWLKKYVANKQREEQMNKETRQLEEERRNHLLSLEYERLRLEEENRVAEEQKRQIQEEKERIRLEKINQFEKRKSELNAEIVAEQEKDSSVKKDLLYSQRRHLSLIKEFIQQISQEDFDAIKDSKEPSVDIFTTVRAVLFLLGFPRDRLHSWRRISKVLSKLEFQKQILEYSSTSAQTTRRFQLAEGTLQKCPESKLEEMKSTFVCILLHKFTKVSLQMRSSAVELKHKKLEIPIKSDPPLDPDSSEDPDDEEEEQDDLEQYIIQSDLVKDDHDKEEEEEDAEEEGSPESESDN